jgi:hypothetical protein
MGAALVPSHRSRGYSHGVEGATMDPNSDFASDFSSDFAGDHGAWERGYSRFCVGPQGLDINAAAGRADASD